MGRSARAGQRKKGGSETEGAVGRFSEARQAEMVATVWKVAEPLCLAEGVELIHVEYQREPAGRTLRLFIDRTGGIHLDDCVQISRQLGDLLDVYLDSPGAYHLEVSSPGADRPLGKKEHFDRFKGHEASIRTLQPIEGRRHFRGTLLGIEREQVLVRLSDRTAAIPLDRVKKARLVNYHGE